MAKLRHFKLDGLPDSSELFPDAVYYIENGDFCEIYVTDRYKILKKGGNSEMISEVVGDINVDRTFQAGENVSSGIAVIVDNDLIYKYDPNNALHIGKAIGITKTSGLSGSLIVVQSFGRIQDAAFIFSESKPCFVQSDSSIDTVVPNTTIIQTCGTAINANTLFINFQQPLKK